MIILPVILYINHSEFLENVKDIDKINLLLQNHQTKSSLIYVLLQITQTVVTIVPGQVIQLAGGYAFPFILGFILSITGISVGTSIAFYLTRILGQDAMEVVFGDKKINELIDKLNSKKGIAFLFVLYLVPGLPKDLGAYAAGLSKIKFKPFLILSLIGRIPGLSFTLMLGSFLYKQSYIGIILISIIIIALSILGFIKRHNLTDFFDRIFNKYYKQ